ncbi:hypothetical protein [Azospirillum argentinense]
MGRRVQGRQKRRRQKRHGTTGALRYRSREQGKPENVGTP